MRTVTIIACVLFFDFVAFFVGWVATGEINAVAIAHAVAARSTNPGPDTDQTLDAATAAAEITRMKVRAVAGAAMFLVTSVGCFAAGRSFERRRIGKATLQSR